MFDSPQLHIKLLLIMSLLVCLNILVVLNVNVLKYSARIPATRLDGSLMNFLGIAYCIVVWQ